MERIQPFLKWAGGKAKLADRIKAQFPHQTFGRYYEPFVGAGAVALNVDFPNVIISDINPDLMNVWKAVQVAPEQLINECTRLFDGTHNNEKDYYKLREEFNATKNSLRKAALFIYLNKHGFNGLCRYNKDGQFNVPYGKYDKYGAPKFDADHIRKVSERIQKREIKCQSFEVALTVAGVGDVVYCDPPYVSDKELKNAAKGFANYSKEGFTLYHQEILAIDARKAAERGAHVIISNHDTEWTREFYSWQQAVCLSFEVQRNISCDGNNRKKAKELLAVFHSKLS